VAGRSSYTSIVLRGAITALRRKIPPQDEHVWLIRAVLAFHHAAAGAAGRPADHPSALELPGDAVPLAPGTPPQALKHTPPAVHRAVLNALPRATQHAPPAVPAIAPHAPAQATRHTPLAAQLEVPLQARSRCLRCRLARLAAELVGAANASLGNASSKATSTTLQRAICIRQCVLASVAHWSEWGLSLNQSLRHNN
jgi:hypothetical protein